MNKLIAFLLIVFTIVSCTNPIGVTENEKQAVEKVLDFYGGVCNRAKGFSGSNTYFELEMSNSELIESYAKMSELPASNIAYLFSSNLKSEEDNYTNIKVKINLKNGESHEYTYKTTDLKEIQSSVDLLAKVGEEIKNKGYKNLLDLFDEKAKENLDTAMLRMYCSPYDSAYGQIKQTQFHGFAFFNGKKDSIPLIHIAGVNIREKENTPISIFVDRKTKKLMTLKFKF